ncbi:MAG TPA: DsbA family protein [Solirubrobacteraceae bacterium]|nr:DsbA family protein [Solirubrobacteraceae bacterium]
MASHADSAFYFDLGSPYAYLVAEQILQAGVGPVPWQPVLARELAKDSWAPRAGVREDVARRAASLGLQALRWPEPFPFDSEPAMRVATYAKAIGRAVPFAQAAFRQAFAGGRSLGERDNVLIAAAACEMHPKAVLRAAEQRSVAKRLAQETAAARELGVREVPALVLDGEVRQGRDCLAEMTRMVEAAAAEVGTAQARAVEAQP